MGSCAAQDHEDCTADGAAGDIANPALDGLPGAVPNSWPTIPPPMGVRPRSMLTEEMKSIIRTYPVGFVASINADGTPNLSPKGTFVLLNNTQLAFGHIRSPGTIVLRLVKRLCRMPPRER